MQHAERKTAGWCHFLLELVSRGRAHMTRLFVPAFVRVYIEYRLHIYKHATITCCTCYTRHNHLLLVNIHTWYDRPQRLKAQNNFFLSEVKNRDITTPGAALYLCLVQKMNKGVVWGRGGKAMPGACIRISSFGTYLVWV